MIRITWEIKVYQDSNPVPVVDMKFDGRPEDAPQWLEMMESFVKTLKHVRTDADVLEETRNIGKRS